MTAHCGHFAGPAKPDAIGFWLRRSNPTPSDLILESKAGQKPLLAVFAIPERSNPTPLGLICAGAKWIKAASSGFDFRGQEGPIKPKTFGFDRQVEKGIKTAPSGFDRAE